MAKQYLDILKMWYFHCIILKINGISKQTIASYTDSEITLFSYFNHLLTIIIISYYNNNYIIIINKWIIFWIEMPKYLLAPLV